MRGNSDRAKRILERSAARKLFRLGTLAERLAFRGKITDATKADVLAQRDSLQADLDTLIADP